MGNLFQKVLSMLIPIPLCSLKGGLQSLKTQSDISCIHSLHSFHNQLKNNPGYMDGKVNKRVDCLVHLLLKYEVDMFFNRQTKDLMWKYNIRD